MTPYMNASYTICPVAWKFYSLASILFSTQVKGKATALVLKQKRLKRSTIPMVTTPDMRQSAMKSVAIVTSGAVSMAWPPKGPLEIPPTTPNPEPRALSPW